ncbi:type VI secretion system ImpA family N-terminal domain-containing protein [Vibrio pacinii]|uniref:type VI secretion system ImpA family N-terminal domain-containing protein n=1 Tax=Vibrio pacinii TaxID=170674 RepID=UPI0005713AFF|nr:type VI secretion system ImpA family N-terminal domain-containing protein [Vibrio pacinii]
MSTTIFLDHNVYHIVSDSQAIRHLEHYQQVRDEINARFNPLSGGTNWQAVYECCEALAKGPGIDLLLSSYMTIAKLKIEGLTGYANGLELIMQCLLVLPKPDTKSAKMRKEVLDWVNGKAIPELKKMKPTQEQLRDLYRSERLCERINDWLTLQQPEQRVNFEGVGFVLFEHIDQIETRYHTALKRQEKQRQESSEKVSPQRFRLGLVAAGLLGSVIGGGGLWAYSHPDLFHKYYYKQSVEVPSLDSRNLPDFVEFTSPDTLQSFRNEMVPMYQASIKRNTQVSIEQPYLEAMEQLNILQQLYADNEQVVAISDQLGQDQQYALEQADEFVARFSEIRTKMANVALLAKKRRWSDVANETKSLESFAVSLSPIYGRVGYVEELIEKQQYQQAQQEFEELKRRLNNLSWKVAQLNQMLEQ